LPYGHTEFLSQRLKAYAVNEPPLKDLSVSFIMNPLVDEFRDLTVA
jgi:hypothetical protein